MKENTQRPIQQPLKASPGKLMLLDIIYMVTGPLQGPVDVQVWVSKSEKITQSGGWRLEYLCTHAGLDELRAHLRITNAHTWLVALLRSCNHYCYSYKFIYISQLHLNTISNLRPTSWIVSSCYEYCSSQSTWVLVLSLSLSQSWKKMIKLYFIWSGPYTSVLIQSSST